MPNDPVIKILAITVRADIGGGPEHLFQLLRAYGSRAAVMVACPDDAPYFARYQGLANVTEVVEIPHRRFQLSTLMQLRALVKAQGVQVIHSHGKGAGLYGRLLAALTGVPCLHTFHGLHVGEYGPAKRAVYLGIERVLGWFTRAAICVSAGEDAQIAKAGFLPAAKRHIIDNGVEVPASLSNRAMDDVLRIVAVNRFDPQKNPALLVKIAERLRDRIGDDFVLTVMGQGDQFDAIAGDLVMAGLDQVQLIGPSTVPRDILRQHDLFLSTSLWEGMPLAVLEAMSEGLVPVVTDVVGNRDVVVHGQTGWLYPADDADAAARLLIDARDTWQATRQAAHAAIAADYSVQRMADRTLGLTEKLAR